MKMVKLYLWCPATEKKFDKKALRRKEIKISGIEERDPMTWVCSRHGTLGRILEEGFDEQ
jgi:hypothetical protein